MKKNIIYYLFIFLVSTIPVPLYFNFEKGIEIINIAPSDSFNSIGDGRVPVPLGMVSCLALIVLYIIKFKFFRSLISTEVIGGILIKFATKFIIFSFVLNLIGGGSLIKFFQLFLIFIVFYLGVKVVNNEFRDVLRKILLISVSACVLFHLITYFYISDLDFPYRYAAIGSGSIYSSLVSWPTVLSLYLGLIVFWRYNIKSIFNPYVLVHIVIFSLLLLDISLSQRRESSLLLLVFFVFFLIYFLMKLPIIFLKMKIKKILIVMFFLSSIFIIYVYLEIFGQRLFGLNAEGLNDYERIDMWNDVFSRIDLNFLLFGSMSAINNMHNYIISIFFSFGIIGILAFLFGGLSSFKYYFPIFFQTSKRYFLFNNISALYFLLIFVLSNTVNSSATQPYFLLNFTLIIVIINARWREYID